MNPLQFMLHATENWKNKNKFHQESWNFTKTFCESTENNENPNLIKSHHNLITPH